MCVRVRACVRVRVRARAPDNRPSPVQTHALAADTGSRRQAEEERSGCLEAPEAEAEEKKVHEKEVHEKEVYKKEKEKIYQIWLKRQAWRSDWANPRYKRTARDLDELRQMKNVNALNLTPAAGTKRGTGAALSELKRQQ